MKKHAAHLGKHLRQRLFFYASGAIAIGWVLGANFPEAASAHANTLGWVMNVLVFLMIYPMMIGLNLAQNWQMLLPMFQAVLLVGYVHLADRLKRYYAKAV